MASTTQITTARQLLAADGLGSCELIQGELVMMTPAGFRHGWIALTIGSELRAFATAHGLGLVTGAETGFHIERDPDTVRAPDAAFVAAERIPALKPEGYFPGAPDLVVEVLSPGDRSAEIAAKIQVWLSVGCRLVWAVDPQSKTVAVHRTGRPAMTLRLGDALDGEDVLPGFTLPLATLFAE